MTEIYKDSDRVLSMILDIQKTYIEYLNQTKIGDSSCDKIRMHALKLEQYLHINNKEREQNIILLQKQAENLK